MPSFNRRCSRHGREIDRTGMASDPVATHALAGEGEPGEAAADSESQKFSTENKELSAI
jgi:hypothetical protein